MLERAPNPTGPQSGRVLIVDDDAPLRQAYKQTLVRRGWTVETASDGLDAKKHLKGGAFDVIISDVEMPGGGGIQLLRDLRAQGVEVPVILVTGKPSMGDTMNAIEHGVFRYLLKPVSNDRLDEAVGLAAGLSRMGDLKQRALDLRDAEDPTSGERALLSGRFDHALDSLWVAFQPIVSWQSRKVCGYEALLRTDEATLANPLAFLDVGERLERLNEIGRSIRAKVADVTGELPPDVLLFVNLHAKDLGDPSLYDASSPLTKIAHRVVLEITERSSLDAIEDIEGRVEQLKALGFRIAVDDLGAGYAGLSSFTQLNPEIAKLDMSLVRGIDAHAQKQSIVRAMKKLCDELGIVCVAEGIETAAERDTLTSLGCDLFQGYLFARPKRGLTQPNWESSASAGHGVGGGIAPAIAGRIGPYETRGPAVRRV
jgi:EAL domain-containing protein (putative c-di-GMP-specific phosphodiesterase class I)/ActR/RegA family two-component response regulator